MTSPMASTVGVYKAKQYKREHLHSQNLFFEECIVRGNDNEIP